MHDGPEVKELEHQVRSVARATTARRAAQAARLLKSCRRSLLRLALQGLARCMELDERHFSGSISALSRSALWQDALGVFFDMGKAQLRQDAFSYAAAISACERTSQWELGHGFLRSALHARLADTHCVNAALGGAPWPVALRLFRQMPALRLPPNAPSYNALLAALAAPGLWRLAGHLLAAAAGVADKVTWNCTISVCEKAAQWQRAVKLLEGMEEKTLQLQTITYNAIISACHKGQNWQLALRFFASMHQKQLFRTVISYSSAISSCEKGRQWQLALQLLHVMPFKQVTPNTFSFNAAISACGGSTQLVRAMGLLAAMDKPDVVSYSSVISACECAAEWQLSLHFFQAMRLHTLAPNVVSYSSTISALEGASEWQRGLHLFQSMADERIQGDLISYNATLACLQRGRRWHRALDLYDDMQKHQVCPDAISNSSVLNSLEEQLGPEGEDAYSIRLWLELGLSSRGVPAQILAALFRRALREKGSRHVAHRRGLAEPLMGPRIC
ncbi:unnamed protein product [Effrenium voratum]|nr:unnamed protein product [Effrenium voratum]